MELGNDVLTVLADGQSTTSGYRDKVLKKTDPASVALKYNDIIAMKRAERSALVKGMDVEYGRRYAIMHKGAQPKYLLPVKFMGANSDYDGFAPRESIHIKMNGGDMNFVHGGISL